MYVYLRHFPPNFLHTPLDNIRLNLYVVSSWQRTVRWQMEGATTECLAWSHHRSSAHIPSHQSPGSNTLHSQQQGELRKKSLFSCGTGIRCWGGSFIRTCLPSNAPQQSGKFHLSSKPSAMELHSPVEGTAMNSSTKQSQIVVTTSGTTLQTVETPTRKRQDI